MAEDIIGLSSDWSKYDTAFIAVAHHSGHRTFTGIPFRLPLHRYCKERLGYIEDPLAW